jgi:hypothetical protein
MIKMLRSSAPAALASSSRSFRVVLRLTEDERDRLDAYCEANFALHVLFRDAPGDAHVIWLATRDKPRTAAAFRRSVRGLLSRLRVDASRLRGTWLVLETDDAVRTAVAQHRANATAAVVESAPGPPRIRSASEADEKVIHLAAGCGAGRAAPRLNVELVR